jgi:dTDP-4-amino-4,6-dideoxygalactose transaminase
MCGATPVPCEPKIGTNNIDADKIASLISPKTRAVIAVHLYGQPADIDSIKLSIGDKKILLFEDAAQAHGAKYKTKNVGSLADGAAFSFYPGKNLGAFGDGGCVTVNDVDVAKRIRSLRNYGSEKKYYHDVLGSNSRLDEIQAAVLRLKLKTLPPWNARRQQLAAIYQTKLRNIGDLCLPETPVWADPVWHLYVVRTAQRDKMLDYLKDQGIQCLVHYPVAPHRSGAYSGLYKNISLPIADTLSSQVLSLPIGPHLSTEQVDYVCDRISAFFR